MEKRKEERKEGRKRVEGGRERKEREKSMAMSQVNALLFKIDYIGHYFYEEANKVLIILKSVPLQDVYFLQL